MSEFVRRSSRNYQTVAAVGESAVRGAKNEDNSISGWKSSRRTQTNRTIVVKGNLFLDG